MVKSQNINERNYITQTLEKADKMRSDYINEQITDSEYIEYISDYNYANSHNENLKVIEEHERYLIDLEKNSNIKAHFVYDTGWQKLFFNSFDIYLYIAILILFTGVFANEYGTVLNKREFSQILKSTKQGRNKTFFAKIGASAIISFVLTVLFSLIDIVIIFKGYIMPGFYDYKDIPLQSIEKFANLNLNMTINNYFLFMVTMRILATVIFSVLICGVSELCRKHIPTMLIVSTVTLIPTLLVSFGLSALSAVDFTEIFNFTPLFVRSTSHTGDFKILIFTIGIWVISCTILNIFANKKYSR